MQEGSTKRRFSVGVLDSVKACCTLLYKGQASDSLLAKFSRGQFANGIRGYLVCRDYEYRGGSGGDSGVRLIRRSREVYSMGIGNIDNAC